MDRSFWSRVPARLAAIGLAAALCGAVAAGCDGDGGCFAPEYGVQNRLEAGVPAAEDQGATLVGQTSDGAFAITASCPYGCSFDSEVGCCWCPY